MTTPLAFGVIGLLFFLSGAAALVYQVLWVRSLTLLFGSSHQAVTSVLGVFMAGLALGGWLVGRIADRVARPLRLYGLLELGIATFALVFLGLMAVYPAVYVSFARDRDDATVYLTLLRLAFAGGALIVPTTLMGGTLPVLSRFASREPDRLRSTLAVLYGLNTLGAVVGALVAAFVLLRFCSVTSSFATAVIVNVVVGLVSLGLDRRLRREEGAPAFDQATTRPSGPDLARGTENEGPSARVRRTVLVGIAISGFCALGYEVLWTRVLTIAIGASVYSFTIMLVAFLTGIAFGSKAYGVVASLFARRPAPIAGLVVVFAAVELLIGLTALVVTVLLRDVPAITVQVQATIAGWGLGLVGARLWASFLLAFSCMVVPAFLMGAAFPLAAEIHARGRSGLGRAVGDVLAWNTIGAILGAGVSGFVLIRLVGIERALELLVVLNAGAGLIVLASLTRTRTPTAAAILATGVGMVGLIASPTTVRIWDTNYLAIFRSNQPAAFATPDMVREAVANTDVLYYAEGAESIVSVIRVKGGEAAFITNGRVEASSHLQAQQCQFTLGHLPMLLARDPRRVLVVGLGTGMTLGSTAVHASVERVTLAEIEPRVIGVARTFAAYNHHVLDNPKLRVVFNDGRNFLMTTSEKFDVITADPIHPWFRGAGYLYTSEYFKLAAEHLTPGGVAAQWLPIYELTPDDLRSVVRTFRERFRYTLLWLTHYDAELIGSNAPLVLDETEIKRRMASPAVAADLQRVMMGSVDELLDYFVMGSAAMTEFARHAVVNTDDRLYLEFSAPFSIATPSVMGANVRALSAHRESILPYLRPATEPGARVEQQRRAAAQYEAGRIADPALALFLEGKRESQDFRQALAALDREFAWFAPARFLKAEYEAAMALDPRPLDSTRLVLTDVRGGRIVVDITAVLVPVSRRRASVMFVDNRERTVYGQRYVDDYDRPDVVASVVRDVMATIGEVYRREAGPAGATPPPATATLRRIREAVTVRASERPSVPGSTRH